MLADLAGRRTVLQTVPAQPAGQCNYTMWQEGIPLFQTFFFGSCLQGGSHSLAIQYIIPFIHSLLDQLFNELCLMAVDIGLVLDIQICTMLSFCPRRTHIQWGCGGVDNQGVWDRHVHTVIFKMDNQQGPTVQRRGLCSMLCAAWVGGELGGEWIHVHTWLSPFAVHLTLSQHCYLAILQYKIKLKKIFLIYNKYYETIKKLTKSKSQFCENTKP